MLTLMLLSLGLGAHHSFIETVRMSRLTLVAMIAVVTVLMVVQVPLDLRTHRLSRMATTQAGLAVGAVTVSDAIVTEAFASVGVSLLVTIAVVGVYGILHYVSPRSMGWGDVLLATPLTLAVAYVAVERVLWWQLVAATTGAAHAVWVRVRSGRNYVPFGPHLLVAAWLMLAVSV